MNNSANIGCMASSSLTIEVAAKAGHIGRTPYLTERADGLAIPKTGLKAAAVPRCLVVLMVPQSAVVVSRLLGGNDGEHLLA